MDETGIDDNETYAYAWGVKGQRIYGMKYANRKKRLSIIGAFNCKKIKAPFLFEGSCTRDVFEAYVEKVLVPDLLPGQVVILDNASFHKGGRIGELIAKAGCTIKYLPPYSPDFNPIENFWAPLKHRIRQFLTFCDRDLYKAAEIAFSHVLS